MRSLWAGGATGVGAGAGEAAVSVAAPGTGGGAVGLGAAGVSIGPGLRSGWYTGISRRTDSPARRGDKGASIGARGNCGAALRLAFGLAALRFFTATRTGRALASMAEPAAARGSTARMMYLFLLIRFCDSLATSLLLPAPGD